MRTSRRAVLLGGLALSVGACGRRSDARAVQEALQSAVSALPVLRSGFEVRSLQEYAEDRAERKATV